MSALLPDGAERRGLDGAGLVETRTGRGPFRLEQPQSHHVAKVTDTTSRCDDCLPDGERWAPRPALRFPARAMPTGPTSRERVTFGPWSSDRHCPGWTLGGGRPGAQRRDPPRAPTIRMEVRRDPHRNAPTGAAGYRHDARDRLPRPERHPRRGGPTPATPAPAKPSSASRRRRSAAPTSTSSRASTRSGRAWSSATSRWASSTSSAPASPATRSASACSSARSRRAASAAPACPATSASAATATASRRSAAGASATRSTARRPSTSWSRPPRPTSRPSPMA